MSLNNTKKCIMPWIHVNMEPTGDLFLCCRASQSYGSLGNINNTSLETIWQGEKYKAVRQLMINGEEPDPCKICYNTEALGGISKRMRENDLWKDYAHLTNSVEADLSIPYIDIRFNNICNLKCRSCRPLHSHSIANEYKKLGKPIGHEIVIKSKNIDSDLELLAPTIEEIYFCGGEPLLMEDHYRLIDKLIEVKNFNVRLRYSTNLTTLVYKNSNIIDKWKQFKNVSIHASLDGIGSKLEYIRHGTKWNQILENLNLIKENNIDLKISPTVSVFNILDIGEICSFYIDNSYITPNDLGVTVLETPYHYSIQTLHPNLKNLAQERINIFLQTIKSYNEPSKKFNYLVNYMLNKNGWAQYKNEFKKVTQELDNFRNESFLDTFPELKEQYD